MDKQRHTSAGYQKPNAPVRSVGLRDIGKTIAAKTATTDAIKALRKLTGLDSDSSVSAVQISNAVGPRVD